jgi:ATP-dependent DNA ligase
VLDGEIVIARVGTGGLAALDFEALQLRVHPAESRVRMLAKETPASVVFFDLLCLGERDLRRRLCGAAGAA